jgi:hypothetical protein
MLVEKINIISNIYCLLASNNFYKQKISEIKNIMGIDITQVLPNLNGIGKLKLLFGGKEICYSDIYDKGYTNYINININTDNVYDIQIRSCKLYEKMWLIRELISHHTNNEGNDLYEQIIENIF